MEKYKIKVNDQSFNVLMKEKDGKVFAEVNGKEYVVEIFEIPGKPVEYKKDEIEPPIIVSASQYIPPPSAELSKTEKDEFIYAPMAGLVIKIEIKPGDILEERKLVCVIEAMKMETEIYAGRKGIVEEILIKPGDIIKSRQPIIKIREYS